MTDTFKEEPKWKEEIKEIVSQYEYGRFPRSTDITDVVETLLTQIAEEIQAQTIGKSVEYDRASSDILSILSRYGAKVSEEKV